MIYIYDALINSLGIIDMLTDCYKVFIGARIMCAFNFFILLFFLKENDILLNNIFS